MTRGQRRAHLVVFRGLAVFFVIAIAFAWMRRSVVARTEPAALGRTRVHDAPRSP